MSLENQFPKDCQIRFYLFLQKNECTALTLLCLVSLFLGVRRTYVSYPINSTEFYTSMPLEKTWTSPCWTAMVRR